MRSSKSRNEEKHTTEIMMEDERQNEGIELMKTGEVSLGSPQEAVKGGMSVSYKNILIGINGAEHHESNEDSEMWIEDESEEDMQEEGTKEMDPLCPLTEISAEERLKLCKPWRKALIIKLLGRRNF